MEEGLHEILQAEPQKGLNSRVKCVVGWASLQRWETEAKGRVRTPESAKSEKTGLAPGNLEGCTY